MADGALEAGGPGRSEELRGRRLKLGEGELLVLIFPLPRPPPRGELTEAEREVVACVLEGATTAAIAARRRTSPRTVANQLQSIFRKLGIASRAELARCFAGMPAGRR
ncbi:MAG: hypothetical protein HS104_26410 [Polyangiaceae bacterium]|nr:hypothetical protein [Polyangiaceae bacterium]MCE7889058.1 hypothetical protein [Sorangiineae bacterium PRO1]MCL4750173.1 hypothetical protein [Myxococcales bacterium]